MDSLRNHSGNMPEHWFRKLRSNGFRSQGDPIPNWTSLPVGASVQLTSTRKRPTAALQILVCILSALIWWQGIPNYRGAWMSVQWMTLFFFERHGWYTVWSFIEVFDGPTAGVVGITFKLEETIKTHFTRRGTGRDPQKRVTPKPLKGRFYIGS